MMRIAGIALLAAAAQASPADELIARVNKENLGWVAAPSPRFANATREDVRRLLGVPSKVPTPPREVLSRDVREALRLSAGLPASFDSRKQWPGCVHPILDQGQCGSCWAFAAAESLSDRFCIESQGHTNVQLSPESLVSCDWEGNMGCNGGIPQLAWAYMEFGGMLTLDCFPYTAGTGSAPWCAKTCSNSSQPLKYYYAKGLPSTFMSEASIMAEIYANGPVEGTMTVYSDFMNYASGVYVKSSSASYEGGHAIKIVGWGSDNGLDYWTVANSWGTSWGMDGFFNIQRGTDMCGIDHDAVAGKAYLK